MDRNGQFRLSCSTAWMVIASTLVIAQKSNSVAIADESLGVKVPDGFEVSLYADDDLAHDIYSMTIDSFGRVVVSGAGYVRILEDTDNDGIADHAPLFVQAPKSGLQGMYFAGRDLIASGEEGLIRYRDRDGNDQADGPHDVFWRIKTGGEHDLHAIRKGPDGWWYVNAGNNAGIDRRYVKLESSPVKVPNAGALLRFTPDLSQSEVYADGFRNAYDFDFGATGDLFTFDSDGERDVSLPWYRPTRVFHILSGSNAGWFSRSWKRPDSFFDMPPVVGAFGRGSPTGVECYRHTQFPEPYRDALFVLDWTYGRVIALPMTISGSTWTSEPIEFMTAVGQHGFAPTDAAVGPDGSLYISVGGRGTRGGVYKIQAKTDSSQVPPVAFGEVIPEQEHERIEFCLNAPQPLSSWSRRVWEPLVATLTSKPFIEAALDRKRTREQRIRAIEILTEKFNGLDGDMLFSLAGDPDAIIRARAAWSIGRTDPLEPSVYDLKEFMQDSSPFVARVAMESMMGAKEEIYDDYVDPIGAQLASEDRYLRQAIMRLLVKCSPITSRAMAAVGFQKGWRSAIPVGAGFAIKNPGFQAYPFEVATKILTSSLDHEIKLEATRVLELSLGDLTAGTGSLAPVYDGYAAPIDLSTHTVELQSLNNILEQIYPSGQDELDWELERIMSIVNSPSDRLLQAVIGKIDESSNPVDDLHRLIVISRMTAPRSTDQRRAIAKGLVEIEHKIAANHLRQDSNWADRVLELYNGLVERDPQLPLALLEIPGFGHPGHVQFVSQFPPERFDDAIAAFSRQAHQSNDYPWNNDVIFLLSESLNEEDQTLVRKQFDNFALRQSVVICLAVDPIENDRQLFYRALESASVETMQECVSALGLLRASQNGEENVALVRAVRQLGSQGEERLIRDQIVELLRRNLGTQFNYVMGRDNVRQAAAIESWVEFVQKQFPAEYAAQTGGDIDGLDTLKSRLALIDFTSGSPLSGEQIYKSRGCIQCHGGRAALGPDLSGVAGRFSRDDLFTAIAFPHRDVSPRYQTTQIATVNGQVYTGLIVYESVDGLVLRDSNNRTYRIETDDIEIRKQLSQSLMPTGLLKDLSDADLTHLYAYLQSLGGQQTASASGTTQD